MVEAHHIPFGVIYNGQGEDSNSSWLQAARIRTAKCEATVGTPDIIIFQSWNPYPQKLLPETDRDAFTSLIDNYFETPTTMTATVARGVLTGRLTTKSGAPIRGATIHAEVKPLQTSGSLSTYTLSGAIPDGTVTAVLGIRVNRECPRQGDCDIRVTDVHVETDTAQPCVMAFAQPSDLDNWSQLPSQQPGQNVALEDGTLHIQMDAAHGMILNSKPLPIPLTGNARLVVRATIPTSSVGTGAFILVFLAPKKEITRQSIPFDVPATELPDASTDKNGRWAQPLPSGQVQVHGQFDGDTTYWPADVSVIGK